MKTYYNEFDKKKCAALKQLINDGHISYGDVDDRPIQEVIPNDLQDYNRCHFFAGIGLWDHALNLAEWPKDRRVWTGSCPCQPFSTAGRQNGKGDDRHLWPQWLRLIEECKPANIFGEQVSAAITHGWLDDVYQGLEAQGYAVGSVVLPASSVGAPHRRERLWFVGDSGRITERDEGFNLSAERKHSGEKGIRSEEGYGFTDTSPLGDSEHNGQPTCEVGGSCEETVQHIEEGKDCSGELARTSEPRQLSFSFMADTDSSGSQGHRELGEQSFQEGWEGEERHHWSSGVWIDCPDGKQRLVEPRISLLANGYPERVGIIHCAGDAIVPQVAAEFIKASM